MGTLSHARMRVQARAQARGAHSHACGDALADAHPLAPGPGRTVRLRVERGRLAVARVADGPQAGAEERAAGGAARDGAGARGKALQELELQLKANLPVTDMARAHG